MSEAKDLFGNFSESLSSIGPLHDPVIWYIINYAGMQITWWDFQNKGTLTSPAELSFVLKVLLPYSPLQKCEGSGASFLY